MISIIGLVIACLVILACLVWYAVDGYMRKQRSEIERLRTALEIIVVSDYETAIDIAISILSESNE